MSGCKIVQLVGGPFHGDTTELGEGKPLVMFDQTSCMEGAKYTLDPEQCAYIYEGTPSTEEAASLLHWFEPFLKEYEDDAIHQGRDRESHEQATPERQEIQGQDEVPPESQSEVQATLW